MALQITNSESEAILRFVMGWLSDLDGRVTTLEDQNLDSRLVTIEGENLDARVSTLEHTSVGVEVDAIEQHVASLVAQLAALQSSLSNVQTAEIGLQGNVASVQTQLGQVVGQVGSLTSATNVLYDEVATLEGGDPLDRIAKLESALSALVAEVRAARHFTITINAERNQNMAYQIVDSDTSKVASLSFTDALGAPTDDSGATVQWASSDPSVFTIDPSSGAITPANPPNVNVVAQVQCTVTNADGSTVNGNPADVEVIAGPPTAFAITVG